MCLICLQVSWIQFEIFLRAVTVFTRYSHTSFRRPRDG